MFCEAFNRSDVTSEHIRGLCNRKGWSAGKQGKMRLVGKSLIFSEEQITWLRENRTLSRNEVMPAFKKAFPKSEATKAQIVAYRKRNGILTGRSGRFKMGQHSWNKGRKIKVSDAFKATMFKKGHTPHNQNYIGHERINHEGYVEISVAMPNPYTKADRHYVAKHKLLWEEENGPVPEGHVLKCLDGDKQNTDPNNWMAIPRALLPRLNGRWTKLSYDEADPEIKPLLIAVAKLQHKAREASKERKKSIGGAK